MMRFMSRLDKQLREVGGGEPTVPCNGVLQYESVISIESRAVQGVRFAIHRISFGRRMELMGRVRELVRRAEFLAAGESAGERMDAALARAEIDRLYVSWGLEGITGLKVDGLEARFTFLMAGSAASAVRPRTPPARRRRRPAR